MPHRFFRRPRARAATWVVGAAALALPLAFGGFVRQAEDPPGGARLLTQGL